MSFFDPSNWLTWVSIAIGLGVTVTVLWLSGVFSVRKHVVLWGEGELPWEQLLDMLQTQRQQQGDKAWEDLPPDQLLNLLLKQLPATRVPVNPASMSVDEASYLKSGRQRRASRRRWLNPIEARLTSMLDTAPQQGLIINQSDGGLAVLTDNEHAVGSVLFVSAVEAPKYVPAVGITVRHVRRAGKLWILGGEYLKELPWNVKVWFG